MKQACFDHADDGFGGLQAEIGPGQSESLTPAEVASKCIVLVPAPAVPPATESPHLEWRYEAPPASLRESLSRPYPAECSAALTKHLNAILKKAGPCGVGTATNYISPDKVKCMDKPGRSAALPGSGAGQCYAATDLWGDPAGMALSSVGIAWSCKLGGWEVGTGDSPPVGFTPGVAPKPPPTAKGFMARPARVPPPPGSRCKPGQNCSGPAPGDLRVQKLEGVRYAEHEVGVVAPQLPFIKPKKHADDMFEKAFKDLDASVDEKLEKLGE
jgi:hypothetical protein